MFEANKEDYVDIDTTAFKTTIDSKSRKLRAFNLSSGDSIIIIDDTRLVEIGERYNHRCIISKIFYTPKKWWQFWKKKKQLGYEIRVE